MLRVGRSLLHCQSKTFVLLDGVVSCLELPSLLLLAAFFGKPASIEVVNT